MQKCKVYVYDFNTGKSVSINGEKSIPVASMIKIPILFELFRQIEKNDKLDIQNKIIDECGAENLVIAAGGGISAGFFTFILILGTLLSISET